MEKLKNMTCLSEKVSIYIPSTIDFNRKIDSSKYVQKIELALSGLFGGCTTIETNGSYKGENDMLVSEKINIVYSYTNDLNNEQIDIIVGLCEMLKKELVQECISLEINNRLYFI